MNAPLVIVTPEQAAAELLKRRELKKSLHSFVKEAWHVWMGSRPFRDSWAIGAICEHIEAVRTGQIENLIINQPPRTSQVDRLSAWLSCRGSGSTQPHIHALCASYDGNLSKRDHRTARELIQSHWYQARFGDRSYQLADDQNTKDQYNNDARRRPHRDRRGWRPSTGTGGDWIIIDDDPNNAKEVSDTALDNAIFWWNDRHADAPQRSPRRSSASSCSSDSMKRISPDTFSRMT
jgi:hypothetical protein